LQLPNTIYKNARKQDRKKTEKEKEEIVTEWETQARPSEKKYRSFAANRYSAGVPTHRRQKKNEVYLLPSLFHS